VINRNSLIANEFMGKGYSDICPVLDMHAHMFSYYGAYMSADTPEKMLKYMDRSGVKTAVFASHSALNEGRDFISQDLDIARRYHERFLCYYPVLSRITDPNYDLKMIESNNEYIGMKFLCDYYQVPLSDEKHTPYWEYADDHKMAVLCHTWGSSKFNGAEEIEKILMKYHNLTFIAGHSIFGRFDEAVRLTRKYSNLILELTALFPCKGHFEPLVEAGLTDRIVFGVDSPWFSYDAYIGSLISMGLSDDVLKDILYRNAVRILDRMGKKMPQYPEVI